MDGDVRNPDLDGDGFPFDLYRVFAQAGKGAVLHNQGSAHIGRPEFDGHLSDVLEDGVSYDTGVHRDVVVGDPVLQEVDNLAAVHHDRVRCGRIAANGIFCSVPSVKSDALHKEVVVRLDMAGAVRGPGRHGGEGRVGHNGEGYCGQRDPIGFVIDPAVGRQQQRVSGRRPQNGVADLVCSSRYVEHACLNA